MSLLIYETPDPTADFSVSGTNSYPLYVAANGSTGDTLEQRMYLRNDEVGKIYSGVQLQYVDVGGGLDMTDGSNGISMKLNEGDTQPTEDQWDSVTAGAAIDFPIISGISTYYPFWSRIEVPTAAPIQLIDDVILKITGTEILE